MSDDPNQVVETETSVAPEAETVEVAGPQPDHTASDDHPIDRAIRAWIDTHIRGSAVAQASEAWNHLNAVLPALRALILRELGR